MAEDCTVVDNAANGRFEILVAGDVAGFVDYRRAGEALSLVHTVVDPRFQGHGVGSALARGVLDQARDRGLAVLPFCPFIRSYLKRHPVYLSLVPADQRGRFALSEPSRPDPA